jgi:hypothetical protein
MLSVHPGEEFYPWGNGAYLLLPSPDLDTDVVGLAGVSQVGFGHGDAEFIDLFIQNFRWFATRMRWM